tara:strand:- start:122 stop:631 length:510 start_codon:yes stop_codon:yes gene_type:complete
MLKKIKIIDNFLDKEVFKKLQSFLLGDNCPWFYNESKASGGYQHQFTHTFLGNKLNPSWSNSTNHIAALLNKINPRVWIRIKSNLTSINSKAGVGGWHYDKLTDGVPWSDTTTSIFYINTNNGYTMFESGKKIPSLENRIVTFPNDLKHTGVSQTATKIRVTINLNYLE